MRRREIRRRGPAFTLVEVLVVVGIIALLLAILLPSLARARRAARRVLCMNNLHALGLGAHGYEATFRDVLPWEGYAEGDRPIRHLGAWEEPSQWFNACLSYAGYPPYWKLQNADRAGLKRLPKNGDVSHLVCSEANAAAEGPKDDLVQEGYFLLWGLNTARTGLDRRKTYWSYGYNTELDAGAEDRHSDHRISLSNIPRPAETVLLAEKLMRPDEFDPPFPSSVGQSAVSWREFTTRHEQGGFLLMLDNHVAYYPRRAIWNAKGAPYDFNQPGKVIWNPHGIAN